MKPARHQFFVASSIIRLVLQPCRSQLRYPKCLRLTFPRYLTSSAQLENSKNPSVIRKAKSAERKAALKQALLQYQELHGDMLVPHSFVVPRNRTEWPERLWGIQLGYTVDSIREGLSYMSMRKELEDIGFVYDPTKNRIENIRVAFMKYKELHGDMLVASNFVVPIDSEIWPRKCWGFKLGLLTKQIQPGGSLDSLRCELEAHGYDCNYQSCHGHGEEPIRLATLKYNDIYGTMIVPLDFEVPANNEDWPEKLWGMRLGFLLNKIKGGIKFKLMRDRLKSRGIHFSLVRNKMFSAETCKLLFQKYVELHGNLNIPGTFVIPATSADWPSWMRGIRLGSVCKRIRIGVLLKENREEFLQLGFNYTSTCKERYGEDSVSIALRTYKQLYGTLRVPGLFVVPHNSDDWPEHVWGMMLGAVVGRIRLGRCYASMREELDSMGFSWTVYKRARYDDALVKIGLIRYKEIRGHMIVPKKFVIPINSEEWPVSVRGLELGAIALKIRNSRIRTPFREELDLLGFNERPLL